MEAPIIKMIIDHILCAACGKARPILGGIWCCDCNVCSNCSEELLIGGRLKDGRYVIRCFNCFWRRELPARTVVSVTADVSIMGRP